MKRLEMESIQLPGLSGSGKPGFLYLVVLLSDHSCLVIFLKCLLCVRCSSEPYYQATTDTRLGEENKGHMLLTKMGECVTVAPFTLLLCHWQRLVLYTGNFAVMQKYSEVQPFILCKQKYRSLEANTMHMLAYHLLARMDER